MEKKKRFVFNFVDLAVIIALCFVLVFAVKTLKPKDDAKKKVNYRVSFYTEESTMYSLENVKIGDEVFEEIRNQKIGNVVKIDISDVSKGIIETADGQFKEAAKPGYGSGTLVFEGEGEECGYGAKFGDSAFSVGQTVTVKMGTSRLYGRVREVEIVE